MHVDKGGKESMKTVLEINHHKSTVQRKGLKPRKKAAKITKPAASGSSRMQTQVYMTSKHPAFKPWDILLGEGWSNKENPVFCSQYGLWLAMRHRQAPSHHGSQAPPLCSESQVTLGFWVSENLYCFPWAGWAPPGSFSHLAHQPVISTARQEPLLTLLASPLSNTLLCSLSCSVYPAPPPLSCSNHNQ